jgi:Na+-transporting methylmalonyl-CoA/oxaloacetate decarboxylase gamma subunit
MSVKVAEINDIPAALPVLETEDEREKLIREAAEENNSADENLMNETEEEDLETFEQTPKPSKKKLFLAFVGFVFGFVFLILILCWFFGIGVFAATKPQPVDRTAKTNSPNSVTPVTEDEKLKMALNLVAEKNPNGNTDSLINPSESENVAANSSVDIPPTKATDLNEPVVVPDALSETNRNPVNSATSNTTNSTKPQNSVISAENPSILSVNNSSRTENQSNRQTENAPLGRSLFFGIERKENTAINPVSNANNQAVSANQNTNSTNLPATAIPFGTLLPIRFLGAVYTLRTSGGLVRMELTRSFSGKDYSYPAGTVLVGTLRGSEYKRAFISVVGLIDPGSGGLVKFEGEVMGNDGASGIAGRRRQVKSTWSRVFGGLREAGSVALGAIGNRRSGGTVIISDSTSKASGALTDELSGLIGSNRNPNEFVEISAGTTGFVLVTDLPNEISEERLSQNSKTATGLSESELADLFSEGSKEKIRAALPRMTPAFRQLAEKVLAME